MSESRALEGRVALVTGAGGGIGAAEARALAAAGAAVVINDVEHASQSVDDLIDELRVSGCLAYKALGSVADYERARDLVGTAVRELGRLDIVINNAGILRDRMLVGMSEQEWDDVIAVHLKGTFAVTRHAAAYWRERAKSGNSFAGRIINTTSASGIYGQVGQSNYGAAKAAIAAFTLIVSDELARYGVTSNAIAPMALTQMNAGLRERSEEEKQLMAPQNIAPLAVWLASDEASQVTGRVFNVRGHSVSVAEGWMAGPAAESSTGWTQRELTATIPRLLDQARGRSDMFGRPISPA